MLHVDNPLAHEIVRSSADAVHLNRYRPFGDVAVRSVRVTAGRPGPSPVSSLLRAAVSSARALPDRLTALSTLRPATPRSTAPAPCCC